MLLDVFEDGLSFATKRDKKTLKTVDFLVNFR
jgi:hypothetical protein